MKKVDLLAELFTAERRVWFVQRLADLEQTDDMLKARFDAADQHLSIAPETSPQPPARFLVEVEQILMTHDLI